MPGVQQNADATIRAGAAGETRTDHDYIRPTVSVEVRHHQRL
jgi:hypothetical protein